MITEQDLALLERLHTPLSKIFLEHLREDHGYLILEKNPLVDRCNQQAQEIQELKDEVNELTSELTLLRDDYEILRKINDLHCGLLKGKY
ncbi:hypothetical protein LCGC14_1255550 [marine sediment metagenome]|uniref:Uncharacterized protein n=1 Tax=marine sediment metagenome TaxID=412755 RepID=A0A0F9P5M2_9ZZZZ